ncbi:MAG TPA: hypothetical protein VHK91_15905, partial [Flavisolibacter sp.]|nr:hypothetical protein [Flavisolibacter sp.]
MKRNATLPGSNKPRISGFLWLALLILHSFYSKAQTTGSRVSFKGTDQKTYTGVIREVKGDQYRVHYDGYDFEAWLIASQFQVLAAPETRGLHIGSMVSFTAVDGKKYTGVIKDIQGNQYKVKYDGFDYEAWLQADQFTSESNQPQTTPITATHTQNESWKVGDKVEAYDMYKDKWYNGTITLVLNDRSPTQWRVTFDEPKEHTFEYLSLTQAQIRPRGLKPASFAINARV